MAIGDMRKPVATTKGAPLPTGGRGGGGSMGRGAGNTPAAPGGAVPKPAVRPAPNPAMTEGAKLRASLRADKKFMDSIKPKTPAPNHSPKVAKSAPKASSTSSNRGYDNYKRLMEKM